MNKTEYQELIQIQKDSDYLKKSYNVLKKQFSNQFIAIKDGDVIAHHPDMDTVLKMIQEKNLFELFRTTQFYDYTKIPNRKISHIANYHLTFSYSHRPEYAPIVIKALKHYGQNVNFAAVFHGAQPESFLGRNVVNGDESDLRFLDIPGVTVALTAKGRAKKDMGGFVIRQ